MAVVVSAACFGTLAVLVPLAYDEGMAPLPLLSWRFAMAASLLAALALVRDRGSLRVPVSDLGRFAILALTGYGAGSLCFVFALKYAEASVVAVLLYAYPALVMVAGWTFLSERRTWSQVAAVAVTFIGCVLVIGLGGGAKTAWQGIALGLGAAVGYAAFSLMSQRWLPGRSRLTVMAYMFAFAVVPPALASWLFDGAESLSPAAWDSAAWVLLGVIVVVPTFVAVVLYMQGIRGLGATQAAVVSTVEPLFTMVLAAWLLHERLGRLQIVGALLVIAGVAAAEVAARRVVEPAAA